MQLTENQRTPGSCTARAFLYVDDTLLMVNVSAKSVLSSSLRGACP